MLTYYLINKMIFCTTISSRIKDMADFKLSLLMTAIMSCFAAGCGGGGAHFSTVNDSQNANTASESATPAESAPEP